MALIPPDRLRLYQLRLDLARVRHNYANIVLAIMAAEDDLRRRRRRRARRFWIKPWILRRPLYGQYENLMVELVRESRCDFQAFLCMEPHMFRELLRRVGPRLHKSHSGRPPLEPGLKLAITLRYLATGNAYRSLAFAFRVPHNTIALFVPEVCRAIVVALPWSQGSSWP